MVDPERIWKIADHSCRHCMGRVLVSDTIARCSECGTEVEGAHNALCWCGVEMPGHGPVFECFRNPAPSVSAPQEVLVRERAVAVPS